MMDREIMINTIAEHDNVWDVIVIGGGATGLGTALESSSRGYTTLLLEQADFAKGTSSRSTKLAHGGVRYLQQGDVSLVVEALHERGLMMQNAPHLVRNQAFVIPTYDWWGGPFYTVGMKVYDVLAGKLGLGPSKSLSKEETLELIPTLEPEGLRGGVIYYDGQFDDARLAINIAQTCADTGGTLVNYMKVKGLLKSNDMVSGVIAEDMETGKEYRLHSRVVINATGVFVDNIIKMDNPEAKDIVRPSQGVHIVLDKEFLPGDSAIMVPKTEDGRVLFVVPWNNKAIVGTTDTPVKKATLEPRALEEEVAFILEHAAKYLSKDPKREDVQSVFAGLRPLVSTEDGKSTAQISRSHSLMVSISGLVTITGGKWTTYRKMGEDTIDKAALIAGLDERPCKTKDLRIHGWLKNVDKEDPLFFYGSDMIAIRKLINRTSELGQPLHQDLPIVKAQVVWAAQNEMARTVEDFLSRRTRALLLNARASIEMAPEVARLLARELGKNEDWEQKQIAEYQALANEYILY
ncbi:glycerol-3-phosphate dehydrogenase/oxidase [Catalinimonas niigatensis]|uniref:glycerol-3-phosphate dehydrogenase/oxidase n=1 Tax=Catalinimonas niigatensis TaxID=1397264 RepID=UPI002AA2B65B|nr:glycerol-3-phosphate dehydrogenase/oxidase [Catalinimonas niigatensis]WPP49703.1 glycerol-3-phosphate dehydrogenase/oxidase [Catalinimonas niigatensis]